MSNLGVFFCLCFLLIGGFRHFFQVRILNAVHELYVFLQHQAFREGAPGVWTVPVGKRQGNNLLAIKGLREERADYRSPQSAQRGPGGPADTSGPKCKSGVAMNHHFQCELKKKKFKSAAAIVKIFLS